MVAMIILRLSFIVKLRVNPINISILVHSRSGLEQKERLIYLVTIWIALHARDRYMAIGRLVINLAK